MPENRSIAMPAQGTGMASPSLSAPGGEGRSAEVPKAASALQSSAAPRLEGAALSGSETSFAGTSLDGANWAGANLAPHSGETLALEMGTAARGEGNGLPSHDLPAEEVLLRMDGASAVPAPRLAQHSVAVGIEDPAHGWIEVRAQGTAGQVTASLAAASPEAHAALHAQLPAMAQYLAERDLGVRSVAVSGGFAGFASPGHAGGSFSQEGSAAGSGSGGFGAQDGSGPYAGAQGNPEKGPDSGADRAQLQSFGEPTGRLPGEPGAAALGGDSFAGAGRLINVRA